MPWTPDQPLVRLVDVHKTFGSVEVLKGVSMDVMKGEVICIIGPSGSGKSTLLRCINALVPMYLYLLLWFFIYCYPIARATLALEKRFAVK